MNLIHQAAENILKLKNKIDVDKMKKPSFLMALTAIVQYTYQREDGVLIVLIGCLKP